MLQTINLQAGVAQEFYEVADFFRVLNASQPLTVRFYWQGAEVAKAEGVSGGYAERFTGGKFDRLQIESAFTQTVQLVARLGNQVFYDLPPLGNVNGAFSQSQKTVTNASAQMLAANLYRRYLMIQNKDSTGSLYINFGGGAATLANGVRIAAGGSYELSGYVPTDAVQAIGDIASNGNVIVIEG